MMKKILLCGFAVLAFSLTQSVNADVTMLNDDINGSPYSNDTTINGLGGWSTPTGTMNYLSANGGVFSSDSAVDATSQHALTAAGVADTDLSVLIFGRFRPDAGFKTLLTLNDGTNDVLVLGANDTANFVTGSGVSGYIPTANPFNTNSHEYHNLSLTYNEPTGAGALFSQEAASHDATQSSFTLGAPTQIASFTGSFDIQALQTLSVTSSSPADRIGSVNLQSTVDAVPEPAIAGLGLMCLAVLAARRRRS